MGEWIHIFLTSALVGGEWSASLPCRLYVCMYVYVYKFEDRHIINNSIIFLLIGLNRTLFLLDYVFSIGRCVIGYYLAM
jgi:hypothetical protein